MTTNDRSRNSGPKRRTRDYAHEHGLTYQQALHLLRGVDNPQRPPRPAIPLGSQILIHHNPAHSDDEADYTLGGELTWKPFTDDTSSCVFLAPHYQLATGTLCHQLAINPVLPVESFLVISACGVEEYDETRWIAEEHRRGAWKFRQFLMAAEEVGYAQAGAAADALADFQPTPGGMGVVVVTMSDPYEWDEPSVGPHWCESYYRPQPGRAADFGATKHVLSDPERRDYTRFLRELERLLHRATADRIVVLFSIEDNWWDSTEFLARCGFQRFGTRLFNGVHTEYDTAPAITDPELFQAMFPEVDLPQPPRPYDRYFWSGMEPKDGRIAYARLPGSAAPGLDVLLLQDPPITPPYWAGSYENFNARPE